MDGPICVNCYCPIGEDGCGCNYIDEEDLCQDVSGGCLDMQDERVKKALISTESELLSLKDRLSSVEALIRYAQLELVEVTQIIQNLSTQKDTLVSNSQKNCCEELTYFYGEKLKMENQLIHDPAKIVKDF